MVLFTHLNILSGKGGSPSKKNFFSRSVRIKSSEMGSVEEHWIYISFHHSSYETWFVCWVYFRGL